MDSPNDAVRYLSCVSSGSNRRPAGYGAGGCHTTTISLELGDLSHSVVLRCGGRRRQIIHNHKDPSSNTGQECSHTWIYEFILRTGLAEISRFEHEGIIYRMVDRLQVI